MPGKLVPKRFYLRGYQRKVDCARCGVELVYEYGDVDVSSDDGLCYVVCPRPRCRCATYVGTQELLGELLAATQKVQAKAAVVAGARKRGRPRKGENALFPADQPLPSNKKSGVPLFRLPPQHPYRPGAG